MNPRFLDLRGGASMHLFFWGTGLPGTSQSMLLMTSPDISRFQAASRTLWLTREERHMSDPCSERAREWLTRAVRDLRVALDPVHHAGSCTREHWLSRAAGCGTSAQGYSDLPPDPPLSAATISTTSLNCASLLTETARQFALRQTSGGLRGRVSLSRRPTAQAAGVCPPCN